MLAQLVQRVSDLVMNSKREGQISEHRFFDLQRTSYANPKPRTGGSRLTILRRRSH
jgi:hypothetical protein